MLAAYAVRLDRVPIFLDIDLNDNALTIPGSICAAPLSKPSLNVEVNNKVLKQLFFFFFFFYFWFSYFLS
jgi:hypothetical protein